MAPRDSLVAVGRISCFGRGSSPHITVRVLSGGCVLPALHLVMLAPPAPRVAEAEPESQQQEVVEQRLRYHDDSGATAPLP